MIAAGFTWMHWVTEGIASLFGTTTADIEHALSLEPGTTVLMAHALLASGLLITLALVARRQLDRLRARGGLEKYFTSRSLTPLSAMEIFTEGTTNLLHDMLEDDDVRTFFPFVGSIFLYLFTCNVLALVPGLVPPTDNINTSFGLAIGVFVLFNAIGLWRDPVAYVKHLAGPMLLVAPMLFVIEVFSLILRPITLSLRITGNLFGDHTAFGVISELVPPVIPALMLGLALFVSFVQAFIFALLTAIYIAQSVPHHEGEEH